MYLYFENCKLATLIYGPHRKGTYVPLGFLCATKLVRELQPAAGVRVKIVCCKSFVFSKFFNDLLRKGVRPRVDVCTAGRPAVAR